MEIIQYHIIEAHIHLPLKYIKPTGILYSIFALITINPPNPFESETRKARPKTNILVSTTHHPISTYNISSLYLKWFINYEVDDLPTIRPADHPTIH